MASAVDDLKFLTAEMDRADHELTVLRTQVSLLQGDVSRLTVENGKLREAAKSGLRFVSASDAAIGELQADLTASEARVRRETLQSVIRVLGDKETEFRNDAAAAEVDEMPQTAEYERERAAACSFAMEIVRALIDKPEGGVESDA